jgi:vacuolar-type H+-ATPase subunit F/Vma7
VGRVGVLGEAVRVQGYALAGAVPIVAESPEEVRQAWTGLAGDIVLLVLTPAAAAALGAAARSRPEGPLTVEMTT